MFGRVLEYPSRCRSARAQAPVAASCSPWRQRFVLVTNAPRPGAAGLKSKLGQAYMLEVQCATEATVARSAPSPVPYFVPGIPHILIELRQALVTYQDYHTVLLTLTGQHRGLFGGGVRRDIGGGLRLPLPLRHPRGAGAQPGGGAVPGRRTHQTNAKDTPNKRRAGPAACASPAAPLQRTAACASLTAPL